MFALLALLALDLARLQTAEQGNGFVCTAIDSVQ